MKSVLLEETINLLREDRGDWKTTAAETGLGYDWLAKLSQGCIDDPGVKKIECLHAYLSGKAKNKAA